MKQILGIIVFVPLALVVGMFAVANRKPLALEVWPLPGEHQMWASVWILGLLGIGIFVGLVIGWLAGAGWRRRARRAERRTRALERQIAEEDDRRAEAALPGISLPPPGRAPKPPAARAALIDE